MQILKKLTKTEYIGLREKVRRNISINSNTAYLKRELFSELARVGQKGQFIVGGIVLEKHLSHGGFLYRKDKGWKFISLKQLIDDPALMTDLQSVETTATVVLFDFSGIFTVRFSPPPMSFAFIKEGDIVYAMGKVSPLIFAKGQGVNGTHLLTDEEMDSYRKGESIYCAEDVYSKEDIKGLKEVATVRGLDFLMDSGGSSMEITHRLLKEINNVEGNDLFWIISAIHSAYSKGPSERLYNLVKKYFYKWSDTQKGMEAESEKESYRKLLFPRKQEKAK